MWITSVLYLFLLGTATALERCGTDKPGALSLRRVQPSTLLQRKSNGNYVRVFPLEFHVFQDRNRSFVNVPDEAIHAQIHVVNDAFAGNRSEVAADTKIRFMLESIHSLSEANPRAIHVFVCNLRELSKKLGQAQFPCDEYDGTVFDAAAWIDSLSMVTVPGIYFAKEPYNLGYTLVHELGHVFGLFHTFFLESCEGPGDYVDDTPQQQEPNKGDCMLKDSCPLLPGADPIENYMDYSHDTCMNQFTPLQSIRMNAEIDRCLLDRALPLAITVRCYTDGSLGSARRDEQCSQPKCSQTKFPNGGKNARRQKWCRTQTGKWGGNCKCEQIQVLPTYPPSTSPTESPTFSPRQQTSSPSLAPSTASPSSFLCSNLSKNRCNLQADCRFLNVNSNAKKKLPKGCLLTLGCRSSSAFCDGLCKPLCVMKSKHCKWEGTICSSL